MQDFADECASECNKNVGGCHGFGFRYVDQKENNRCVLLNRKERYNLDGFSCEALCPVGNKVMMNIMHLINLMCSTEEFYGWQNAGEFQTNLLNVGCNPYLNIGEECASVLTTWVNTPRNNNGCPSNSTCRPGRIQYAKSCETEDSFALYQAKANYNEELREKFTIDYHKGAYDAMLGKDENGTCTPEGYTILLPETLVALSAEQYALTVPVVQLQGLTTSGSSIHAYSQECTYYCNANEKCIGVMLVYLPDYTKNQCRMLQSDGVEPDANWEFTALRCNTNNPCPSGNNIMTLLMIPAEYNNCGVGMFLGYDLGLYNQIQSFNCHYQLTAGEDCGIDGPQVDVTNMNGGCVMTSNCIDESPFYTCRSSTCDDISRC
eukprot:CFRG1715T1